MQHTVAKTDITPTFQNGDRVGIYEDFDDHSVAGVEGVVLDDSFETVVIIEVDRAPDCGIFNRGALWGSANNNGETTTVLVVAKENLKLLHRF